MNRNKRIPKMLLIKVGNRRLPVDKLFRLQRQRKFMVQKKCGESWIRNLVLHCIKI